MHGSSSAPEPSACVPLLCLVYLPAMSTVDDGVSVVEVVLRSAACTIVVAEAAFASILVARSRRSPYSTLMWRRAFLIISCILWPGSYWIDFFRFNENHDWLCWGFGIAAPVAFVVTMVSVLQILMRSDGQTVPFAEAAKGIGFAGGFALILFIVITILIEFVEKLEVETVYDAAISTGSGDAQCRTFVIEVALESFALVVFWALSARYIARLSAQAMNAAFLAKAKRFKLLCILLPFIYLVERWAGALVGLSKGEQRWLSTIQQGTASLLCLGLLWMLVIAPCALDLDAWHVLEGIRDMHHASRTNINPPSRQPDRSDTYLQRRPPDMPPEEGERDDRAVSVSDISVDLKPNKQL